MQVWVRDPGNRLSRETLSDPNPCPPSSPPSPSSSSSTMADDNISIHDSVAPPRLTLQDRCYPTRTALPSCFSLPPESGKFEIKPHYINMLPKFHGLDSEDAYVFITKFQNVCNLMGLPETSSEAIKLHLLPLTLLDQAEKWIYSSSAHSIKSWDEFVKAFLRKFYPNHKTAKIRSEIIGFTQLPNEPFWKCWERLKDLMVQCPHHGFEKWRLCQIVYEGLTLATKQMLETICQCNFLSKEEEEAWQFLEDLAEQTQQWESTRATSRAGIHQVDTSIAMKAEVAAMQKKIEAMESKLSSSSHPASSGSRAVCSICSNPSHRSNDCPLKLPPLEQVNAFQAGPRNDPFSSTYNPGWRNHPNFSWSQNQPSQSNQYQGNQNGPHPPPSQFPSPYPPNFVPASAERVSSLERSMEALMKHNTNILNQLAQISTTLSAREKGSLPSQSVQNPGHLENTNLAQKQGHQGNTK